MAAPIPPKQPEAAPDSGDAKDAPRFDEKIRGDSFEVLRHYQDVTLPPNARINMLQAQLPEAPPEQLLQDTVPPNGNVPSPPRPQPETTPTTSTVAPVVDRSRSQNTVILPRVKRKRQLRTLVIGAVALTGVLILLGVVLSQHSDGPAAILGVSQRSGQTPTPPTAAAAPNVPALTAQAAASATGTPPVPPAATTTEQASEKAEPSKPSKHATAPTPKDGGTRPTPPKPRPGFDPSKPWEED